MDSQYSIGAKSRCKKRAPWLAKKKNSQFERPEALALIFLVTNKMLFSVILLFESLTEAGMLLDLVEGSWHRKRSAQPLR